MTRTHRRRFIVAVAVACVAAAASEGTADEARPNQVHLTGLVDVVGSQDVGGGGGVEWFRAMSPAWGFTLGGYSYGYADSHWGFGRLGAFYSVRDWTIVSGLLDVGGGRFEGHDSAYQVYKAGLLQALVHKRVYVSVEEQYARYARFEEPLLKAGLVIYPTPWLTLQSHYHVSTGGNVDSEFVSARVDALAGRFGLLAGGLVGRTAPQPPERAGLRPRAVETREAFGGVSVPVGDHTLRFVLTVSDQSTLTRYRAEVGWTIRF